MNSFHSKAFHSTHMPTPTHRLKFLLLCSLLIAVRHAATAAASIDLEKSSVDHRQDIEARQFDGFNSNAAFNINFGLNRGGGSNGVNSGGFVAPTTTTPFSFNIPIYSRTTSSPNLNSFNNFNQIINTNNNNKKTETEKQTHNDFYQKKPDAHYVDRFNHRYPDGSYEYRFELSDGTTRYERGYFLLYDNKKTLVVVGYYAYRMADGRYITVFYNADQNGYRQNQSITPKGYPNLPRSIDVPQYKSKKTNTNADDAQADEDDYYTKTKTTSSPRLASVTTRRAGHF